MKILALYLPQYHSIPENDRWWGEGYTEWTAVRAAKPLFAGHEQPRVPLEGNYYDLSDPSASAWKWQADLANLYSVYGFCIYHYWFGEKQLLEKPMEILRDHPEINIRYCVCWANETWTRTWYGKESEVLIAQEYGDEAEWTRHFEYLNSFFSDERYIKIEGKPLVHIYRPADIPVLKEMVSLWDRLAREAGYEGVRIVVSENSINNLSEYDACIDGVYRFEPGYSSKNGLRPSEKILRYLPIALKTTVNKLLKTNLLERKVDLRAVNSRALHNYTISKRTRDIPTFLGLCPQWDNTPRRGTKGTVYTHSSPGDFRRILKEASKYVEDDEFVYINAWNEWGEGCYLEPDRLRQFEYLEVIRSVAGQDSSVN